MELYHTFHAGEKEWQQLLSFAKKDSIDLTSVSAETKAELLEKLPAQLARQMWRSEGYYEVSNQTDEMVKKALAVMQ
jgi:carboxyl-terminal processing protease